MANNGPTVVMMAGLQGAGKTTNAAKLAGLLRRQNGKRPLLAACDMYRPAAIKQLKVVGGQLDLPVFEQGQGGPGTDRGGTHSAMPGTTAVIWCSWIPPAASMWMRS